MFHNTSRITLRYIIMSTICCASVLSLQSADSPKTSSDTSNKNISVEIKPTRHGYFDIDRIITLDPKALPNASAQWRDEFNRIQKLLDPAVQEIEELKKKFEKGVREYQTLVDKKVLSADADARRREELGQLEKELYYKDQEYQNVLRNEFNKAQAAITEKLNKIGQELATVQGWSTLETTRNCIYVSKDVDLTDQILSRLNKDYVAEQAKKETAKQEPKKPQVE